ncbi:hypothetical protein CCH79_00020235 [Gambusia affinis]|uniref:Uncharacterized protein n=1 Tax=Gambusia affinis TaxID=33528 RepID=A0A315W2Q9_GAMAF|nr:hypothetical protein CCH79_00020235 [Gambusia affinis]
MSSIESSSERKASSSLLLSRARRRHRSTSDCRNDRNKAAVRSRCIISQVHRWVNYESMLKECLVGRMTTKAATASKAIILPSSSTGLAPPAAGPPPPNKDSHPRYDWFQTDATVHLAVYAKRKVMKV